MKREVLARKHKDISSFNYYGDMLKELFPDVETAFRTEQAVSYENESDYPSVASSEGQAARKYGSSVQLTTPPPSTRQKPAKTAQGTSVTDGEIDPAALEFLSWLMADRPEYKHKKEHNDSKGQSGLRDAVFDLLRLDQPGDRYKVPEALVPVAEPVSDAEVIVQPVEATSDAEVTTQPAELTFNAESIMQPAEPVSDAEVNLQPAGPVSDAETIIQPAGPITDAETIIQPIGSASDIEPLKSERLANCLKTGSEDEVFAPGIFPETEECEDDIEVNSLVSSVEAVAPQYADIITHSEGFPDLDTIEKNADTRGTDSVSETVTFGEEDEVFKVDPVIEKRHRRTSNPYRANIVKGVVRESEAVTRLRHEKKELEKKQERLLEEKQAMTVELNALFEEAEKLRAEILILESDKGGLNKSRALAEKEIRKLNEQLRRLKGENEQLTKANITQAEKLHKVMRRKRGTSSDSNENYAPTGPKPTYEQLEQRVKQLNRSDKELKQWKSFFLPVAVFCFIIVLIALIVFFGGQTS